MTAIGKTSQRIAEGKLRDRPVAPRRRVVRLGLERLIEVVQCTLVIAQAQPCESSAVVCRGERRLQPERLGKITLCRSVLGSLEPLHSTTIPRAVIRRIQPNCRSQIGYCTIDVADLRSLHRSLVICLLE